MTAPAIWETSSNNERQKADTSVHVERLALLPGPQRQKIRSARCLRHDREVSYDSSLQWIRQHLISLSVQILQQAVVDSPCESPRKAPCQRGVSGMFSKQSFAMNQTGARFLARQECCSQLDAIGTQSQCGDDPSHIDDVDDLRNERERTREGILRGPKE